MRSIPCPFCGESRPRVHKHTRIQGFFVYCHLCLAHGPIGSSQEQARKAWNERPTPKQARAEDKAFKKALNKYFGKDEK